MYCENLELLSLLPGEFWPSQAERQTDIQTSTFIIHQELVTIQTKEISCDHDVLYIFHAFFKISCIIVVPTACEVVIIIIICYLLLKSVTRMFSSNIS